MTYARAHFLSHSKGGWTLHFLSRGGPERFRCIYGLRTQPTDSRPVNRFSCNGTFPVDPERSVATRTASSERKLMLMDAMSEFDASNRNCCIGKRLEAFH